MRMFVRYTYKPHVHVQLSWQKQIIIPVSIVKIYLNSIRPFYHIKLKSSNFVSYILFKIQFKTYVLVLVFILGLITITVILRFLTIHIYPLLTLRIASTIRFNNCHFHSYPFSEENSFKHTKYNANIQPKKAIDTEAVMRRVRTDWGCRERGQVWERTTISYILVTTVKIYKISWNNEFKLAPSTDNPRIHCKWKCSRCARNVH